MSFLTPKCQFSYPFSILQLVKSLPFYISPARKGYPFRAEPPRIVHYRESPRGVRVRRSMANWQSKVLCPNRRQVAGHKSVSNPGDHGIDCKHLCSIFQETGILVLAGSRKCNIRPLRTSKQSKSRNTKTRK